MNRINKANKVNNSNFNGIKPKTKEVKTLASFLIFLTQIKFIMLYFD